MSRADELRAKIAIATERSKLSRDELYAMGGNRAAERREIARMEAELEELGGAA